MNTTLIMNASEGRIQFVLEQEGSLACAQEWSAPSKGTELLTPALAGEAIREDAYVLYGFADKQEREIFLLLISVSGIGGNTARMILSALSPAELVNVISTENANLLKTVKGIGLKTAQRVIVDLKDKIKTMGATVAGGSASAGMLLQSASVEVQEEAVAALTMLGFAAAPSQKVVLAILKEEPDAPVEKVIKLALKRL